MKYFSIYFLTFLGIIFVSIFGYFFLGMLSHIFFTNETYPEAYQLYITSLVVFSPFVVFYSAKDMKTEILTEEKTVYLKNSEYLSNRKIFFLKSFYATIGALIILFPPQYYAKAFMYSKYGKFNFILNSNAVDIYFYIYEVFSYILIGCIVYFLLIKKYKNQN